MERRYVQPHSKQQSFANATKNRVLQLNKVFEMANICNKLEMEPLTYAQNLEEIRREENYETGGYKMINSIEDTIIIRQNKGKPTGKEDEIADGVDQFKNQQQNSSKQDNSSNKQGKTIDRQDKKIQEQGKGLSKQEQIADCGNKQGEVIFDNNSVAVVLEENADDTQNDTLEFAPSAVPTNNKQRVVFWTTRQLRKACKWILGFIFVTLVYYLRDYLLAMMEQGNNTSNDDFNMTTIATFNDDAI